MVVSRGYVSAENLIVAYHLAEHRTVDLCGVLNALATFPQRSFAIQLPEVANCKWMIAFLRAFGGRLLNLNGGNPIRLCCINRDDSKIRV